MKDVKISYQESLEYISSSEKSEEDLSIGLSESTEEENKKIFRFFSIVSLISFTLLFIISWLSLIWLYKYHFIFTFYRYINSSSIITYFPIQIPSVFLFGISILTVIIITISYIYYIKKIYINKNKTFYYCLLVNSSKYHIIPIILNTFLFSIGFIVSIKIIFFHIYYFICLILVTVSLYFSFKLYFEISFIDDYLSNIIIKYFFLASLIEIDLYYFFYVLCQIFNFFYGAFSYNLVFLGVVANVFMGVVCLFVTYVMENFLMSFFFAIIYNGIIGFHYLINVWIRKDIGLGSSEVVVSVLFSGVFVYQMVELFRYKIKSFYS